MSTADTQRPPLAVVILAAGLGTRMKSDLPKVLHEVCGRPMLSYVIDAALSVSPERIVVVTGPDQDAIAEILPVGCERAVQQERRGTGDAVRAGLEPLEGFEGDVMVLCGDVPLVDGGLPRRAASTRHAAGGARATVATAVLDDPGHYGRIVRDGAAASQRIVEARDAAPDELLLDGGQHRPLRVRIRLPSARLCPGSSPTTPRASSTSPTSSTCARRRCSGRGACRRATTKVMLGDQLARRARGGQRPRCAWRLLERLMLAGVTVEDPRDHLCGLGRRGGPRHAHPRQHAPAGTHHRRRGQRGRPRQLPPRRLRRRPRPRRQLAPLRVRHRLRLQRRPLRLHPPQHRARRRRQGRHLRRDQEQPHRRAQQGAAPQLRGRRHRRPRQQHRRRQHHRQLRRLRQTRDATSATACAPAATPPSWRRCRSATAPSRRPAR